MNVKTIWLAAKPIYSNFFGGQGRNIVVDRCVAYGMLKSKRESDSKLGEETEKQ